MIAAFLSDDHRRLEDLLGRATAVPSGLDRPLYEAFRRGLLRHIGMEEKVLLPAMRRAAGPAPVPAAVEQIRLDHGAIVALLVPTPTASVIERLSALLADHDALEEGPEGVYATAERLLGGEAGRVLDELRAYPEVPTKPHLDGGRVEAHIALLLRRAGRRLTADPGA